MDGKKPDTFVIGRWRYNELEPALADVFSVDDARMGALRGRLKRLTQLGIFGSAVRAGRRQWRRYSLRDVGIVAAVFLLEDLGVSLDNAAAAFKRKDDRVKMDVRRLIELGLKLALDDEARQPQPIPRQPVPIPNPVYLTAIVEATFDRLRGDHPLAGVPWIGIKRRWDLRTGDDVLSEWIIGTDRPGWRAARNLTDLMLALYNALPPK